MTSTATTTQLGPDLAAAPGRQRWLLLGSAAGLTGLVATLVTDLHVDGGASDATPAVVDQLSQGKADVSVVVGYVMVALLLVLAAAWRRHVEPRVLSSTAARVVPLALTSAAGASTLGYGWKGAMAVYLPGGVGRRHVRSRGGLYIYYLLNDFGSFIGWLGVTVAAGAVAWMALRERLVSRWIGVISVLPVLAVVAMTVGTGLPGFPGVVTPLWMVVAFTGMALGRSTISR